ncbi:MAG: roadblock/LC7 domain-containing protein [Verrucomicrobiae bacterium]|nr:roadblock/LC7 domain-containing protein [Verrucomicrobiae bacterium]
MLTEEKVNRLEASLAKLLDDAGATYAFLADMGGNLICSAGRSDFDGTSLAVLSAANFAATREMASLIGEKDFSLLFHRGENENIHFTRINPDVLLIVLFKPYLSLGLLRLKVENVKKEIASVF